MVQVLLDVFRLDRKGLAKKHVSVSLKDMGDQKNESRWGPFPDTVWNRNKSARYRQAWEKPRFYLDRSAIVQKIPFNLMRR